MKSPNYRDTEFQLTTSHYQTRLPVESGCIQLIYWPYEYLQTIQVVAKTMGCSLQTDSVTPLLRENTHTTHCIWRHPSGAYVESSFPRSGVFGVGRHPEGYQKMDVNTNPATEPLTICLSCKICQNNTSTGFVGASSQPTSDLT